MPDVPDQEHYSDLFYKTVLEKLSQDVKRYLINTRLSGANAWLNPLATTKRAI